jgi:hypothetical protein
MATPEGATSLGRYIYLFKSKTNSVDCIISAHGGFVSENRGFRVPKGVNLLFYGEHGASLIDPGIADFFRNQGRALVTDTAGTGDWCRNYLLSKYQGTHNNVGETYDQIKTTVNTRDLVRTNHFKTLMSASSSTNPDPMRAKLSMEQLKAGPGGSILTIRNRWDVFAGIPLLDAIKAAKKEMPTLRDFHCIFCRSAMLPDKMVKFFNQTVSPDKEVNYGG